MEATICLIIPTFLHIMLLYVCVCGGGGVEGFWALSQNYDKRLLAFIVCSAAWNNSTPTGRILIKSDI